MAHPKLPKRFRPFLRQAKTEAALRYGSQESALGDLRRQAAHDYAQGLLAQQTATQSLLGSLNLAPQQITSGYSSVGLTSPLLASMAQSGSPTAQRIAGEQAAALAGIAQQRIGAQAGQVAGVNRLTDTYNENVGQIGSQETALAKEKGLFTQDLLDQLISSDRSARHAANQELKKEQFQARQDRQGRQDSLTRSIVSGLIGQGVQPVIGKDGSVSIGPPIPGAKANRPKAPRRATSHEQQGLNTDFTTALQRAQQGVKGLPLTKANRQKIARYLLQGAPALPANQPLYNTATGKRALNKNGQPLFTGPNGKPTTSAGGGGAIKPIGNQPAVRAALDMVFDSHLSQDTVNMLHRLGYSVNAIPNVVTAKQYHRRQAHAPQGRLSPLAPGANGQLRPT